MNVARQKAFWGQNPFSSPRTAQGRAGGGEGGGGERRECQVPEQIGCLVFVSAFLCDAGCFFFFFVLFGFSLGLPLANLRRLVSMALVKVSMDLVKFLDRV